MKTQLVSLVFALVSSSAIAAPMWAELTDIQTDPQAFGDVRFSRGSIMIDAHRFDTQQGEATLTLFPADGRKPFSQTLPLVSVLEDRCGVVTYTALVDKRRVDGVLKRLVIVDQSELSSGCMSIPELKNIEVSYETDGYSRAGSHESHSEFSAEEFIRAQY